MATVQLHPETDYFTGEQFWQYSCDEHGPWPVTTIEYGIYVCRRCGATNEEGE